MQLKGKTALITGAARGIGLAHARRLAKMGANIVISDIDLKSYEEFGEDINYSTVMEEIESLGVRCIGIVSDVGNQDQVNDMVEQSLAEFGHIDILINNAGGLAGEMSQSFAGSVSAEDLKATFDRNLMGTIYCSQAVSESMKKLGWGRIVTTSSQAGLQSQGGGIYASYGAAKAGVIAYTRYLAQELGPYNITVNCLVPAYVATERLNVRVYNNMDKDPAKAYRIPLGRLATPDDVAKVAEFFVSDLSDYVTGQALNVCGGALRF